MPKTQPENFAIDIKRFKKEAAANIGQQEGNVEKFEYGVAIEGAWVKNDCGVRIKRRNLVMKERVENDKTESHEQW